MTVSNIKSSLESTQVSSKTKVEQEIASKLLGREVVQENSKNPAYNSIISKALSCLNQFASMINTGIKKIFIFTVTYTGLASLAKLCKKIFEHSSSKSVQVVNMTLATQSIQKASSPVIEEKDQEDGKNLSKESGAEEQSLKENKQKPVVVTADEKKEEVKAASVVTTPVVSKESDEAGIQKILARIAEIEKRQKEKAKEVEPQQVRRSARLQARIDNIAKQKTTPVVVEPKKAVAAPKIEVASTRVLRSQVKPAAPEPVVIQSKKAVAAPKIEVASTRVLRSQAKATAPEPVVVEPKKAVAAPKIEVGNTRVLRSQAKAAASEPVVIEPKKAVAAPKIEVANTRVLRSQAKAAAPEPVVIEPKKVAEAKKTIAVLPQKKQNVKEAPVTLVAPRRSERLRLKAGTK